MKVCILGSKGNIGSAFIRLFNSPALAKNELNICQYNQRIVPYSTNLQNHLKLCRPDILLNCVGRVGGIAENLRAPFDLVYENAFTSALIAKIALNSEINRYVYFAPACVYPAHESVSYESMMWQGMPEESSLPYASAKLMGIQLIKSANEQFGLNWKCYIPTNLFGPFDWNHGEKGHVISMLSSKILQAKKFNSQLVNVWGSGNAIRDFLLTDDFAKFVFFDLLESDGSQNNVITNVPGYGSISIKELTLMLSKLLHFKGNFNFDSTFPEGALKKVLGSQFDTSKYKFENDLETALRYYLNQYLAHNQI